MEQDGNKNTDVYSLDTFAAQLHRTWRKSHTNVGASFTVLKTRL